MHVVVQESREKQRIGSVFQVSCRVSCSLPLGLCVLQTGIAREPFGMAIRSFARGTLPPKAAVLGYAWQRVASKVHGPIATCKSRQSISRMRMRMQTDDIERVGTRGRHGMTWHDMTWNVWV